MNRVTSISAGIVIVKRNPDGWNFLLLRSHDSWDFPKGGVEEGEEFLQAAIREVREETTITDPDFIWGFDFVETRPYRHGQKIARYYLAATVQEEISLPIVPALGRAEHEEYRWMNYQEAYPMVSARVRRVMIWAREIIEGIPK